MTENPPPTSPASNTLLSPFIRWMSVFLLGLSVVMLPILSGTTDKAFQLLALALGGFGAFFLTLLMIFEQRIIVPWGWVTAAGALVLAAALMSGLQSDCPQASLVTFLTWLGYAAAFLVSLWMGASEPVRRQIARMLCALALPIAVYGIVQYAILLDVTRAQIEADPEISAQNRGKLEDYPALLLRTNQRVFSTFALPNSLAGYLLLLIPPSVALAVTARRRLDRAVLGIAVLLMLLGFFFTFSKGGWLAGSVVLFLFLLTAGRAWLREHKGLSAIAVVAAAAVLAVALLVSPALQKRIHAMSGELGATAHVRSQYWAAASDMWRTSPALGIGPGNFQNHYMKYAPVAAEETKSAHNDYIQLLAECGPLAFAGYALFWVLIVVRTVWTTPAPSSKADELVHSAPRFLCPAAGFLGIAAAAWLSTALYVTDSSWTNAGAAILFAALWLVAWHSSDAANTASSSKVLTIGLGLGLLGFALHSLVDLDLYVDGLACTAFVAAGLAAAPWLRTRTVPLGLRAQIPILVLVSLVGIGGFYVVKRVSEAGSARVHGVTLGREGADGALDLLREACDANPLDHESFASLGNFLATEYTAKGRIEDLEQSLAAWTRATKLNPSFADYHAHLGNLFAAAAVSRPEILREYIAAYRRQLPEVKLPVPGREIFTPAIVESGLAVRNAPGKPQYRRMHGEALWLGRLVPEAREQFQIALDLHNRMMRLGAPPRQWLTEREVNALKSRLGLIPSGSGAIIPK